jgi:hypothetical protein
VDKSDKGGRGENLEELASLSAWWWRGHDNIHFVFALDHCHLFSS